MSDSLREHLLKAQIKAARSQRRITQVLALYLVALVAAAIVLTLTGCGSSAPAPAASPSATHAPAALSRAAACRILRTNILANGGTPDRATLQRIIDQGTNPYLLIDVQAAKRDLAADDGGMSIGFDVAMMGGDCRVTGVQIPQNGGT
jgi:hypothetical protein